MESLGKTFPYSMQASGAGRRGQCVSAGMFVISLNAVNPQTVDFYFSHSSTFFLFKFHLCVRFFIYERACAPFFSAFLFEFVCMPSCAAVGLQDDFSGAE